MVDLREEKQQFGLFDSMNHFMGLRLGTYLLIVAIIAAIIIGHELVMWLV